MNDSEEAPLFGSGRSGGKTPTPAQIVPQRARPSLLSGGVGMLRRELAPTIVRVILSGCAVGTVAGWSGQADRPYSTNVYACL
jgi:hypothetical protein